MAVAVMAGPNLFILRGGCDAGGHHRECHFPRLGFHLWYLLNLFVHRVLLEVFVEFSMAFVVLLATTVLRRLRQRGISACGMVLLGGFVTSAWRSSSSWRCGVPVLWWHFLQVGKDELFAVGSVRVLDLCAFC